MAVAKDTNTQRAEIYVHIVKWEVRACYWIR